VAELVREREHRVERVVVIHQHVRIGSVHRRGIRAAPLALVFVDVDPALGERAPHARLVFRTERRDRLDDPIQHVFVGVLHVVLDERNERIEDVVVREVQHALAQLVVAAERCDAVLGFADQVFDDARRGWRCRIAPHRASTRSRGRALRTSRRA
jgi:hypothetical protein